jgi:hypothetical protein
VGAGTGLLYLVRWYWWRVTAWCEIIAMVSSFVVSITLLILAKNGVAIPSAQALLLTVAITTVCWIATAYLGPKTDERVLIAFYQKVRPYGPGWRAIREQAGISAAQEATDAESGNFPLALLGWSTGCMMIWSALFTVGNFLYGRTGPALALLLVFSITAVILSRVVARLWR